MYYGHWFVRVGREGARVSFGVSEEHQALTETVARWAARHSPPEVARTALEAEAEGLPACWSSLHEQGLLGLHVSERRGGVGYGPPELAVVLDRLGAALTPGPVLPTAAVSLLLERHGPQALADEVVPALAAGERCAGIAIPGGSLRAEPRGDDLVVSGTSRHVLGAGTADLLLLSAETAHGPRWLLLDAVDARVEPRDNLDGTRRVASMHLDGVALTADRVLPDLDDDTVRDVVSTLAAAEMVGVADWCLDTAVEYAKVREQFGRPIGQFQSIKHLCAQMLVRTEQARATAWDAAYALEDAEQRPLAAAVARAVAFSAAVDNAKDAVQILGGIGYTWEHDVHLYLRRATATRALFGPVDEARVTAARRALSGQRRDMGLALPEEEAAPIRTRVRAFAAELADLDEGERRRRLADEGYLAPHWPRPWGRDASPIEQVVIAEELAAAGIEVPDLVIGKWILPTIISHGTEEQLERFVPPTFRGELTWCQMFSEPGAGSDLASLSTKAARTDGGWLLTGQKVWTSLAHESDYGMCLARTDTGARKHEGITAFIVDMSSPGLDIRPLREMNGRALFNEIFLNDVFVPDDHVIGELGGGWRAARTTLANERVEMSSGSTMGRGVEGVLQALAGHPAADDRLMLARVGELVCEGQSLALLGHRTTLTQLSGTQPGAASSVRKLVGMGHAQETSELAFELLGAEGAAPEGEAESLADAFIRSRSLTIAGGTTQVLRNVIAERMLGLPRDP
jgi:3-oxochol-4-en-24-oyl-CoA dehydrogenase